MVSGGVRGMLLDNRQKVLIVKQLRPLSELSCVCVLGRAGLACGVPGHRAEAVPEPRVDGVARSSQLLIVRYGRREMNRRSKKQPGRRYLESSPPVHVS